METTKEIKRWVKCTNKTYLISMMKNKSI
jgi:hypothetical protein